MTISYTHLVGDLEGIDETVRYFIAVNWMSSRTDGKTPTFISPHGYDTNPADKDAPLSQNDVKAKMKSDSGLITFETIENRYESSRTAAGHSTIGKSVDVYITIYAQNHHMAMLYQEEINNVLEENLINTTLRVKKSDGIQDSAICSFENSEISFSTPEKLTDKGTVLISSGFLTAWIQKNKS